MAQLLIIFISCYLLFLHMSVTCSEIRIESRIVGGMDATIEEVPYLVQIWRYQGFHCGGSRVSDRRIVTAAHCVYRISLDSLTVVAGVSRLRETGIRSKVEEAIYHPDYNPQNFDLDVAVMKLKTPFRGPILAVPLTWDINAKPEDVIELYGWGSLSEDILSGSRQLQTVAVKVIAHDQCHRMYKYIGDVTENMFCAASPGKDSCAGDSGGPALLNGEFVGIVSWGLGCARNNSPGVYTNVTSTRIRQFLKHNLNPSAASEFNTFWQ